MGIVECRTKWVSGLQFESAMRGHKLITDAKKESGGEDLGPTPKELLLSAICGCSGIDVVMILKKMRVDLQSCEVQAKTETTATQPSIFDKVRLQFLISGSDIKPDQAMRAVDLSMTKYCGVSAMVVDTSPILYEVILNNIKVGEGQAAFEKVCP